MVGASQAPLAERGLACVGRRACYEEVHALQGTRCCLCLPRCSGASSACPLELPLEKYEGQSAETVTIPVCSLGQDANGIATLGEGRIVPLIMPSKFRDPGRPQLWILAALIIARPQVPPDSFYFQGAHLTVRECWSVSALSCSVSGRSLSPHI